jgi:hypothetical protein
MGVYKLIRGGGEGTPECDEQEATLSVATTEQDELEEGRMAFIKTHNLSMYTTIEDVKKMVKRIIEDRNRQREKLRKIIIDRFGLHSETTIEDAIKTLKYILIQRKKLKKEE